MAVAPTNKRVKTLSITRPIIYGNTATPFGEKRPEGAPEQHTHTWTVFVRGPNGEDLSDIIKKVVFKLHETYPNSTRSIESPPFEVTETGWGEFDINIKVFFVPESNEKNISIFHHLRLHPYGVTDDTEITEEMKNVESITYDELVFNEPTEQLFQIMTSKPGNMIAERKSESKFSRETEKEELAKMDAGLKTVNLEIEKLRRQIIEMQQAKSA